jgi:hypothetical protein
MIDLSSFHWRYPILLAQYHSSSVSISFSRSYFCYRFLYYVSSFVFASVPYDVQWLVGLFVYARDRVRLRAGRQDIGLELEAGAAR